MKKNISISQSEIDKISKRVVELSDAVAFGGKAKGNMHLSRVAKTAEFIAKAEQADIEISVLGAWIHDIGLIEGNDDDPQKIREIALQFLKEFDLSPEINRRLAECVESHEGMIKAKSIEAMVVHDADVLDKMGLRGVVRHTWKLVNLINPTISTDEIFITLKEHLSWRKSLLYTKTARGLAEKFAEELDNFFSDEKEAKQTITFIASEARKGIISDEILEQINKKKVSL